jgi:hypothetical protein
MLLDKRIERYFCMLQSQQSRERRGRYTFVDTTPKYNRRFPLNWRTLN